MQPKELKTGTAILPQLLYQSEVSQMSECQECSVCLGRLSPGDVEHPLLCFNQCGILLCTNCITHIYKSKPYSTQTPLVSINIFEKSPPATSCPQCQSDIPSTVINDTLILRNARKIQGSGQISDSELSAAELRLKHSTTVQDIIDAKKRLQVYESRLKGEDAGDDFQFQGDGNSLNANMVISPRQSLVESDFWDKELLDGLHHVLSEAEQLYIIELMTCGDVDKLAQAAQILSEMRRLLPPSNLNANNQSLERSSSTISNVEARALDMAMTVEERIRMQQTLDHRKDCPLPPMPRFVMLQADFDVYARHGKMLKFKDDVWDGTVANAFARVHTTSFREGVEDGLEGDYGEDGRPTMRNRVIVTASRGQAAKLGVQVGDVVSHVNGDEFRGNAHDLKEMINKFYLDGDENYTFNMVLNAEESTAAALKLRSMVDF